MKKAEKLQVGDEVRVIAPARSASDIDPEVFHRATRALESLGLKVSFGKNIYSRRQRGCPTDDEKVSDLHEAFLGPNVKGIIAAIGGFNSNQLLDRINWEIIRENPKVCAGFSDITVLNHAILAKTGLITYVAPNFYCFGLPPESDYSLDYFKKCVFHGQVDSYEVIPSSHWYDFPWEYDGAASRATLTNVGLKVLQGGTARGVFIGGNLCSLSLLHGTQYFPDVQDDIILCIEDDSYDSMAETVERNVQSLMQQSYFRQVKAILVGRFQRESAATEQVLEDIFRTKGIAASIPIVTNLDFGHTDPKFTYPVGGRGRIEADRQSGRVRLTIYR
ncbi:MAG: LD-carboxypeptidase [Candidatus Saccharibacteria bacterium]|nr:LD-carboxypeptidase [Candidatus Saccharibacteria bacterium]